MNREIKFRAYHQGVNKYVTGSASNMFQWIEDGQPILLEQFTGLKDKNGKEIYEGDKVKCTYYNHSSPNYTKEQIVSFEYGCFWLMDLDYNLEVDQISGDRRISPIYEFFNPTPNKIEVIGNIHE